MAKLGKVRLDQTLVSKGLAASRNQAQALIMAGKVFIGETRLEKAGQVISDDLEITVRGAIHPGSVAVGRNGSRLSYFNVDPRTRLLWILAHQRVVYGCVAAERSGTRVCS